MIEAANLTPRQRTLLLLLGENEAAKLDPIRIMKGLFLVSKETPAGWLSPESRYTFEPYIYGPFSSEVYSDIDVLKQLGLVTAKESLGRSWKHHWLTPAGVDMAHRLGKTMHPDAAKYFSAIREFVQNSSFRQLLSAVYHRYPEYAVNSVFKL